jgi:DNA-binding transcriptional ArsR family regulator
MTQEDEPTRCAKYLKALADPVRLRIVESLRAGEMSVTDIATLLEIDIANVSHHLRVLHHADVVTTKREGKFIYYSLDPTIFAKTGRGSGDKLDFGCCRVELGDPK